MKLSDITVEVRDKDLNRVGLIRPEELILSLEDTFNNVGTWSLTLASENPMTSVLRTPGSGIIVTGPTDVLMSGPTITPTFTANADDPRGTVTIEGVSDSIVLADMLAFPDPTNVNPTTQTLAHDVRTGNVESLMHAFVNANVGPSAPAARRKANLIMGTNSNRGPVVKKSARFPVLGNLLEDLAVLGDLGFRIVQRNDKLVFETYAVTDRSDVIRLDVDNGTLASEKLAITPPGVTQVIIAGQGEQISRKFYAATSADATAAEAEWGRRIERFVDQRQTDDESEYESKANSILKGEGFTGISVKAVPTDDTTMRYGHDFSMGDTVSAIVFDGELKSIVTGIVLKVGGDGFRFGFRLGDLRKTSGPSTRLRDVESRVSYLERSEGTPPSIDYPDNIDALTGHFSGDVSAGSVSASGPVSGTNGVFSGNVSGIKGIFSGAVSGTDGTFSGDVTANRVRILSQGDASLTSTTHGLQIGPTDGFNIIIDGNEIMARNNGQPSQLVLVDNGQISVPTPTADNHPATRLYVDTHRAIVTTPIYATGWAAWNDGIYRDLEFYCDNNGMVTVMGLVKYNGGTGATTKICSITNDWRPKSLSSGHTMISGAVQETARLFNVQSDGLYLRGALPTAGQWVMVNGRYPGLLAK